MVDGQVTNQGATKILQQKVDDEIFLRLQHREKQGLFYQLIDFVGLRAEYIGNEFLLRTIIELVAPCWTRCIYRYPPLAKLIWKIWYMNLPPEIQRTTSPELPNGWQKIPATAELIIKKCPFCNDCNHNPAPKVGNLEHLHVYCSSPVLEKARKHCHDKLKTAIYELYDFAAIQEYNVPFSEATRKTMLQEKLELAAVETERLPTVGILYTKLNWY